MGCIDIAPMQAIVGEQPVAPCEIVALTGERESVAETYIDRCKCWLGGCILRCAGRRRHLIWPPIKRCIFVWESCNRVRGAIDKFTLHILPGITLCALLHSSFFIQFNAKTGERSAPAEPSHKQNKYKLHTRLDRSPARRVARTQTHVHNYQNGRIAFDCVCAFIL